MATNREKPIASIGEEVEMDRIPVDEATEDQSKYDNLYEFLLANPMTSDEVEFFLSPRFKAANWPFKIKPMTHSQFSEYMKAATAMGKKKNIKIDSHYFQVQQILNHCVEPNFKSKAFLDRAGLQRPEQALDLFLNAGEVIDLVAKIQEVSGFDTDMDAMIDDVKN